MGTRGSQGSSLLRDLGSDLCYQSHRALMTCRDERLQLWPVPGFPLGLCLALRTSSWLCVCLDSLHRGLCLEFLPGQSH